jgi:hypothetical protein
VPGWRVVGPAAAAAILASAGVSWFAARAHYGALLAEKETAVHELDDLVHQRNAVITTQQRKLSALSKLLQSRGVASEDVDAQIEKLKGELATAEEDATAAPRDPNALYQAGHIVGIVRGANPDMPARTVTFSAITSANEITLPGNFEFMQWRLACADSGLRATTTLGQRRELNYYRVACKIR